MKTMKNLFAMALVAVLGLAGCQQELVDPNAIESDALKVYATIEDAGDTKTSLNEREVYWSSGDQIAVFMKNSLRKRFDVSSESVGSKEGVFIYDSDYIVTGKKVTITNNVAYYPFAEVTCTPGSGSYTLDNVSLPSIQSYSSASFGQGAFPMVAVTADTDDLDFAFKNLCGVLALQLKGSGTIKSITVKGNSDEILSGKATVTASYGKNPSISLLPDGSKTVTLDCGETGVALQNDTPTSFYIVLPPMSFDNGFTVTVTDASGAIKEYSTTKKNAIHRSGILRMPEKEYVGERVPQEGDYIDEYGINHGQGIAIGATVWAPVNCGYHETDFKYGKLYQWGRKYGQGYSGKIYDGNWDQTYSDAELPIIEEGGISILTGSHKSKSNVFFTSISDFNYDWLYPQDGTLWNTGSESKPVKTEYDPCPEGWRVPTNAELSELRNNYSSWTTADNGQMGRWFSGPNSYTATVPQVFFPAAGLRRDNGDANYRGYDGTYWSSNSHLASACILYLHSSDVLMLVNYRVRGHSVRCVQDDATLIPVENITLNKSSLTLSLGTSETLSSTITPSNANHRSAHWWSENLEVASVDQNGNVTAVSAGTTTIYAMAGMLVATCEVTVTAGPQEGDYIDEYGINHGQGVEIDGVVWAPVNCGYHATDFKYGKLYQWGRKYGQGYSGSLYDVSGSKVGTYSDAVVPTIVSGPVDLASGQSKDNKNIYYKNSSFPCDWLSPQNDELWNSGTEENPVKTEYDPCPAGWRVPTSAELSELIQNKSSWTADESGQPGYWFSGASSYTENVTQVFFSAAGYRLYYGRDPFYRGYSGSYWSSRTYDGYANDLGFHSGSTYMYDYDRVRAYGYSVRCVQDDATLIPVENITLNKSSLTLSLGTSETLSSTITPSNANHRSAHWWSENPEVASVDQNGNVTAVSAGTTSIYAMAGMLVATCEVTVTAGPQEGDYIDEYGINHGQGVEIDGVVWAPVNCGYHATDYQYGKLYQWGRKYGQGFGASYDAVEPTIEEGPVSLNYAQHADNANVFFTSSSDFNYDWLSTHDDKLWNSGTESAPVRTHYDPCPKGWRVPTYAELNILKNTKSSWTTNEGQKGYWFSCVSDTKYDVAVDDAAEVFFPAAGHRYYGNGGVGNLDNGGYYWSSRPGSYRAYLLSFYSNGYANMDNYDRALGCSVRCVQE